MQAITATPHAAVHEGASALATNAPQSSYATLPWMQMYCGCPDRYSTLFELEAMVAKRMELLAWIDQMAESPQLSNFDALLDAIGARLPDERRSRASAHMRNTIYANTNDGKAATILGQDESYNEAERDCMHRAPNTTNMISRVYLNVAGSDVASANAQVSMSNRSKLIHGMDQGGDTAIFTSAGVNAALFFTPEEDLVSHLLCRYAFCMSDRWRRWFVRTEELLLRARIKLEAAKRPLTCMTELMKLNGLPCEALTDEMIGDVRVRAYMEYRSRLADANNREQFRRQENYYTVTPALATRLIKTRRVLCRAGRVILFREQVHEVFMTIFRTQLNKGLHKAYLDRMRLPTMIDEDERTTVMAMLDSFLEHFVQDPSAAMEEMNGDVVHASHVKSLARTHFPLCMRQIDAHLRREGHLKHSGRFIYGLFLKAIGVSMDEAMTLFSSLMTVKTATGGCKETFAKTAYGYNIRHNYGMEGKKTSYSSASCATIMTLPPMVDRFDCHGCPFRFRDETALRTLLAKESPNPCGSDLPDVHASMSDIEDIINDCKGQHYTRACYKYFMATHTGVRRDTLFRSPYEYYLASKESEAVITTGARANNKQSASITEEKKTTSFLTATKNPAN